MDVIKVSAVLLAEAGSLAALLSWKAEDFRRVKGIGRVKSLQLLTVMEVARRVVAQAAAHDPEGLSTPVSVYKHFVPLAAGLVVEKLWVLCLNRKYRLLKRAEITSGTATSSLAHPREIFREAIRSNATAIVLRCTTTPVATRPPARLDFEITRQMRGAAEVIGIQLCSTTSSSANRAQIPRGLGFYSFRDAGMLA